MEGVVRLPSEFGMTTGSPPSMTATQELVVPRSMPMTLAMVGLVVPSVRRGISEVSSPDADVRSRREKDGRRVSHCSSFGEGGGVGLGGAYCAGRGTGLWTA